MNRLTALLKVLSRFLVVAAAAVGAPAWGQDLPAVKGEVYLGSPKAAAQATLLTTEEEMPARRLRLAPAAEYEFASLSGDGTLAKRAAVGFGREVPEYVVEGSGSDLVWAKVGDYRIAKLRVQSPGAAALRVALRVGATRQPWDLRVAGSDDESRALGPVRQGGPVGATEIYWTPVTEGDAQVVEIASPASQPEPRVEVLRVSHLVTGPSTQFAKSVADIGRSLSCEIDMACLANPSQALLNAANAVAKMISTRASGGSFLCTGTLLNDTDASTQVPYLHTGDHCFDNANAPFSTAAQMQAVASTLNTYFFFDATACASRVANPAFAQLTGGATFLYNNVAQDVLFLRLNDSPPAGAFLSGWDPNALSTSGAPVTVLHHPMGDLKKFTSGVVNALETLPAPQNAATGYWRTNYDQGVTEGGSSGTGLLSFANDEYLFRGSLWGGNAFSCTSRNANGFYVGSDWYSRFDIAYPALRQWLQPTGGPAFDVTDLWWNAPDFSESGWGLNLTQHPSGQVFAVWYTYDTDFGPFWLVMSGGQWVNSATFSGRLYTTSGPNFTQPFDPNQVNLKTVGTMTLTFADANNGAMNWTVNGVSGTKVIKRQPF